MKTKEEKYNEILNILKGLNNGFNSYGSSISDLFGHDEDFSKYIDDMKQFLKENEE